jgi:mutual gliding-motility protein MglA
MVQINFAQKSVTVKIVYYGPGMSGKTTNLEVVHQRAPEGSRGDLTSISTDGDRTLFFDFMPLDLGTVAGMKTQFQIYTVPGQVYYNSTRKLVLQGVDGVIFIGDSSASMMEENLESLRDLHENLTEYGKDMATMPMVVQYNKRDLPDALPVEDLERALNPEGRPFFEAVANTGQGVFPTLKALAALVLDSIHQRSGAGANSAPAPVPAASQSAPPPPLVQSAGTGFYPAPESSAPAPQPAPQAGPAPSMPPPSLPLNAPPGVAAQMPPAVDPAQMPAAPAAAIPNGFPQPAPVPQAPASQVPAPQPAPTAMPMQPSAPAPVAPQAGPIEVSIPGQQPETAPSLRLANPIEQPAAQQPGLQQTGFHQAMPQQAMPQQAMPQQAMPQQAMPQQVVMTEAQPQPAATQPVQSVMQVPTGASVPPPPATSRSLPTAPTPRIKPRTAAMATPIQPGGRKSAMITAAFVTVALAAGVAIGGFAFGLF